jgi:hypothetical protein
VTLYAIVRAAFTSSSSAPRASSPNDLQQEPKPTASEIPSLLTLFMSDFKGKGSGGLAIVWQGFFELPLKDGTVLRVSLQLIEDHHNISKFIAFYIPDSEATYGTAEFIANNYKQFLNPGELSARSIKQHSPTETKSSHTVFTGRIFIYHETTLTLTELGKLEEVFIKNSARPEFEVHLTRFQFTNRRAMQSPAEAMLHVRPERFNRMPHPERTRPERGSRCRAGSALTRS